MKSVVGQFIYHIVYYNLNQLNRLLEENCLFINYDNTLLGKEKVTNYLKNKRNTHNIKHISILNSVQDSKDTLFISYNIIMTDATSPIYGSAVVRIKDSKINYIRNYLVK